MDDEEVDVILREDVMDLGGMCGLEKMIGLGLENSFEGVGC